MTQREANITTLTSAPTPEQSARRCAVVVALHALDKDDEALLLDALGLNGRNPRARMAARDADIAPYVHGARSGVEHHLEARHAQMCAACERWVEVQERRTRSCTQEGCSSAQAYWRHRNAREPTCSWSREAYNAYAAGVRAARR